MLKNKKLIMKLIWFNEWKNIKSKKGVQENEN